ncbi:MAG: family 43 glycosylhydrolase [Clostridia bacterium]|nr:family 43 glycosylhydrolase [Clostridia bacterium]
MKRVFAVFMSVLMLMQLGVNSTAAFDMPKLNESEWENVYNNFCNSNALPTLNVGADETQVSLCWHTDKSKAVAEVEVSTNADMTDAVVFKGEVTPAESAVQAVCRVTITGLEEHTTYYYRWNTGKGWSEIEKFETKSFGKHKAMIVGDIQIAEDWHGRENQIADGLNWNNVLAEALEKNPDISYLVSPGDNTSSGETAAEWQTLLMPEAMRSLPVALAIGNHDKKGMMYNYYTNMPNEYYGKHFEGIDRDFWFRYGDVLYLVFASTSGNAPDHMAMAKEAVSLNPDAKWRVGVVHHGIYGAGDCIGDMETEILLKTIFAPIFESYDLDLVITGHTHSQGRSHFMRDNKIVQTAESGGTFTNPDGVLYLNSNSGCGRPTNESYEADHLAYSFLENDTTTYTTLEFDADTMTLKTFRGDNSELLDSVTIKHTEEYKEKSFGNKLKRFFYNIIEFIGWVYVKIDSLVKNIQSFKESGGLFAKNEAEVLIENRADPYITRGSDGWYYFTASYPMNGGSDPEGYDRIILRRARVVADLATAEEIVIWDEKDSPTAHRYIWAPEIHEIGGKWYVYFAASDSADNVWDIRCHVIACEGDDPYTDKWVDKGRFQACDGDDFSFRWFSLDMTYFEAGGKSYVAWAQTDGNSNVYLATVDPAEPWKTTCPAVLLTKPEYDWEKVRIPVNEGPAALVADGKVFLTFSASATGPEYCIGLMYADENADLTDVSNWTKLDRPLLTSDDIDGEYGPGHNCFVYDECRRLVLVYHSRGEECYKGECGYSHEDSLYDPCRSARTRFVQWDENGLPVLNK